MLLHKRHVISIGHKILYRFYAGNYYASCNSPVTKIKAVVG